MTREGGADSTVCKIPFWDIRRNRENSTYHVAFSLTNSSAILHQLSSATHNTSMNFNNIEFLETSFLFTEFIKDDRRRRFNGKILLSLLEATRNFYLLVIHLHQRSDTLSHLETVEFPQTKKTKIIPVRLSQDGSLEIWNNQN